MIGDPVFFRDLALILVAAVVGGGLAWRTRQPLILGYVLGFAWLVAIVISGVRLAAWRCPRCHNWFFARRLGRNPFARACLHCGLPKWAAGPQPHSGGHK